MKFWNEAVNSSSEPLTEGMFRRAMDAIKGRDDWERAHPHGYDPENPHIVSPKTRDRLRRENGGYAICGVCGPCYIHGSDR